jgi:S-adenosylmethionine:tRNA ribosyltransferase-isomerase
VRLDELDFDFPEELIAQEPCRPRDACRLLVADPQTEQIEHRRFGALAGMLVAGDVLVLNESKVFPARTWARRPTGGKVELLFLGRTTHGGPEARDDAAARGGARRPAGVAPDGSTGASGERWEALARPSGRLREGEVLRLCGGEGLELTAALGDGRWVLTRVGEPGVLDLLHAHGETPLPPYIKQPKGRGGDYQTVYANTVGSAAAPTAGLHFTEDLLRELAADGVVIEKVTLHVGVDTFRPITEDVIEDHVIHSEHFRVDADTVRSLDDARASGRRVIAVGSTSVRVLETLYAGAGPGEPARGPAEGATRLYVTPGYEFRAVDALLTNFHLPRTSLLALVMAFGGNRFVRACYEEAVRERYRFFSFGDAMFLRSPAGRP